MPHTMRGQKGSTDIAGTGKANGVRSHAEGTLTVANAAHGHAEGDSTNAAGTAAHAEGALSMASGSASHAEGDSTSATGSAAHSEGVSTSASGTAAHAGGTSSTASGTGAFAHGNTNTASGYYATALGVYAVAPRRGQLAVAACNFVSTGEAQASIITLGRETTNATPALLTASASGAVTLTGENTNVLTIPTARAHQFRVSVVARRAFDAAGDTAGWTFTGLLTRSTSGSAAFVGTPAAQSWGTAGAAAWDVTLTIDTSDSTNNYLAITVTGQSSATIRWVARIDTVEVT